MQQIFLHAQRRITKRTWEFWQDGIRTNMRRPAFAKAWADVASLANGDFAELRAVCPPRQAAPAGPVGDEGA